MCASQFLLRIMKRQRKSNSAPSTVCVRSMLARSELRISVKEGIEDVPVKMLCGHDCSLCAPPTALSVFCPGFNPLHCDVLVSDRMS